MGLLSGGTLIGIRAYYTLVCGVAALHPTLSIRGQAMKQPNNTINVGRATSGGVLNGLFGNPYREKVVSLRYVQYLRQRIANDPAFVVELKKLRGKVLFCPGCGVNSPTCHARVLEEELSVLLAWGGSQTAYRRYYGL